MNACWASENCEAFIGSLLPARQPGELKVPEDSNLAARLPHQPDRRRIDWLPVEGADHAEDRQGIMSFELDSKGAGSKSFALSPVRGPFPRRLAMRSGTGGGPDGRRARRLRQSPDPSQLASAPHRKYAMKCA